MKYAGSTLATVSKSDALTRPRAPCRTARLAGGTLNGLYAHVTHDGTTDVITSDMITAMTLAGTGSIQLGFSTPIPAATAGGTATLVIATNTLAGTTPVTSTVAPEGDLTFAGSLIVTRIPVGAILYQTSVGGALTLAGALNVTAIPRIPVTFTLTPNGALALAGALNVTRMAASAVLYQTSAAGALTLAGSLTTVTVSGLDGQC